MLCGLLRTLRGLLREVLRHPEDRDEEYQRKRLDALWTDGSDFSDRP